MSNLKKIVTILFLLCTAGVSYAYSEAWGQINFSYISIKDGLSQSTVFSIAQDKLGNMWFATYDGVNKYDGYAFTVYQHDENDPNSIANDIARIVMTDSKGRVWIGTRDGLSYYDEEKDKFQNFFYEKNGKHLQVNGIVELSPDRLLISTLEGLTMFDVSTSRFVNDIFSTAMHKTIASALYRHGDQIYIGTPSDGMYCYSVPQKKLEKLTYIPSSKQIQGILQQSPTRIWVATEGSGLLLINPKTREVKIYRHSPSNPQSISSNYIRSLALDSQNRLWIGTFNDLNIYHEGNDSFMSYSSNPVESGSLSQRSVRSIFMDSQGGMWLGTYFGGLNYYHPIRNRFKNIERIPFRNSLSDNVVSCIVEDRQKNLWIGTNDGGLNLYTPDTQQFVHYALQENQREDGFGSNNIKSVYVDEPRGLVYIGAHAGGLSILHRNSGRIENFNQRNSRLINENVYAILPDGENNFLLGTLSALVHFNPEKRSFTTVTQESDGTPMNLQKITTLFRDSQKRLWIGGEEGISVFKQHGTSIQKAAILPESTVTKAFTNYIYEAANGLIWVGTREGFYCFNEKEKRIKRYTTANGLPNNVVYGILEDSYGRLWMSTNRGISCFNPETEKFRNFTEADGLQSNQFTASAYCRTANGKMYFGGIKGITAFQPEEIVDNPYTPPVIITHLRLFNKKVTPGDGTRILKTNIRETRSITLTARQSMFSLDFVAPNYISGQHNTFAYMLQGYDKEWYYTDNQRTVSYSNLPAGTYRFLVKAANSDGKWNEKPTELEITVLPVWYKTWWAVLMFTVAFIAVTIFIFRYFWMRKSMQAELQMERVDKERQKEVNEMKLRFFINISHELRTPLTLILAPVQEMMDKISDRWLHKQLEHVQKNTNRLLHLVNQLMDYRRAELGVFNLKVRRNPIHKVIEKDFLFYDRLAQRKRIAYNLSSEVEGKEILCDPNYLELIVNNLLSNAFKYTDEGKSITVVLRETGKELLLQVRDTGNGIPIDKQAKIFERFYQADNEHMGSGIGLSLVQRLVDLHHGRIELESREGEGSAFSIYLPTEETAYRPEEIATRTNAIGEQQVYTTNNQDMYIVDTEDKKEVIKEETAESDGTRKEKILIVEDNLDIRRYLSDELGKSYHISEAGNGEEALALMKEQEADLILTDVMMPVMDGLQLCKQIKQNLRTCHIPIIILSAKADLKEQLEGLQVGADDYIPKPFSMAVITTKIRNLFRTRYRAIEHYSNSLEVEPEKVALNVMDEELLKKAVAIVEKHMDDVEFSTDDFAREICMSRSNLHLKLKALTGDTTNDFIRKIRFNRACKLLKEERYTVAEISAMVGFNTPSYFSTSFKKYFGCLPSEYIKS